MATYPPPTETLPIFNSINFTPTDTATGSGGGGGGGSFLNFPNAQGTENMLAMNVAGIATFNSLTQFNALNTFTGDIALGGVNASINYFDTTQQTSAYTGAGASAGAYTNTNVTLDAYGKITAISNGTPSVNLLPLNNTWTGTNTFNTSVPTSTVVPSTNASLTNKLYVDTAVAGTNILPLNNTWSGTNTFNISVPTSTVVPATNADLTNKLYVDTAVAGTNILPLNNTWTGTNTFNVAVPTSTVVPATNADLTNKLYVDTAVAGAGVDILPLNNTWTGTNTFNAFLPTSTATPTTSTQLTTKSYVDGIVNPNLLPLNNTWTGTNAFNAFLPTSTATPTTSTQLTTKSYVDGIVNPNLLPLNNTWTGTNQFNNTVSFFNANATSTINQTDKALVITNTGTGSAGLYVASLAIGVPAQYQITPPVPPPFYPSPDVIPLIATGGVGSGFSGTVNITWTFNGVSYQGFSSSPVVTTGGNYSVLPTISPDTSYYASYGTSFSVVNAGTIVITSGSFTAPDIQINSGGSGVVNLNSVATFVSGAINFTPIPICPTATAGTSNTSMATTAFVANAISLIPPAPTKFALTLTTPFNVAFAYTWVCSVAGMYSFILCGAGGEAGALDTVNGYWGGVGGAAGACNWIMECVVGTTLDYAFIVGNGTGYGYVSVVQPAPTIGWRANNGSKGGDATPSSGGTGGAGATAQIVSGFWGNVCSGLAGANGGAAPSPPVIASQNYMLSKNTLYSEGSTGIIPIYVGQSAFIIQEL
jgi:hypothetical protein